MFCGVRTIYEMNQIISSSEVSIVVPVYNAEATLNKCLESIRQQDFKNFEALLIDDGSTDGSGKICEGYVQRDERFKYFHKSNGGVSSARQLGLEQAQGKYLIFVDSDDWVEVAFLDKLHSQAEKTGADIVYCDFSEDFTECVKVIKQGAEIVPIDCMRRLLTGQLHGSLCNKLVKRKIYIDNDVSFPIGSNIYEDLYVCLLLFMHSKIISTVQECLYHYQIQEISLSRVRTEKQMITKIVEAKANVDLIDAALEKFGYKETLFHELNVRKAFILNYQYDLLRVVFNGFCTTYPEASGIRLSFVSFRTRLLQKILLFLQKIL